MSSIQERLQLKRVPLDTWNIKEQLCLASAVVRSGDQNWMSVSRALKTVGEPNRPPDWYSQKSCAAQYGVLLEHVETPKRKKRSSEGAVETPQESILKKLTQERIVEIQKTLAEMNQQYDQIKNEVVEVHNPLTSSDRLREIWTSIESRARAREREAARRAAWLKERDERRARPAPAPAPPAPAPTNTAGSPAPPASPLLTSLLKSSPVVTTPQHITHPANVVDTMSPSVTAPTLSMLLEKCGGGGVSGGGGGGAQLESKHAAIEHIKSQLVQIEHQLKASNPAPLPPAASPPAAAPPLDIDDIEIKAEDVYAFRDVDIHIPPVTAMHKPIARVIEKPIKKEDAELTPAVADTDAVHVDDHIIKDEPETISTENIEEEVLVEDISSEAPPEVPIEEPEPVREATPEAEVKIAFPEVKFPTTEIKVIQPEGQKMKEEIKEVEIAPAKPDEPEVPMPEPIETVVEEISEPTPEPVEESKPVELPVEPVIVQEPCSPVADIVPEPIDQLDQLDPATIPLPPDAEPKETKEEELVAEPPPLPVEAAPEVEQTIEERLEMMEKGTADERAREPTRDTAIEPTQDELKPEIDEDCIPLKEMLKEECGLQSEPEAKPDAAEGEDPHTETDDDTPMELSREEEKDGKKKRDYSRKKKSESRTWSGSESAEASAPESPHAPASDADRQHRLWKKSVMLVYSRLCAHKYASLFVRPISDEEAPGYSQVVKRPMDMTTIRRHIDTGLIRTTAQFQREVLLMLTNALMYNSSEHSVYTMAKEMHKEAQCQLGMLVAAQAHAALVEAAPATRKRRRQDDPPPHHHIDKRHH